VPAAYLGGWHHVFLRGIIANYEGPYDNIGSALARDN
jgi:hypothetical protein